MTLKETFLELAFAKISSEELRDESVKITDNFAIGFAEYCLKFDNLKNESTYLIEQLLKIYKKEKEL